MSNNFRLSKVNNKFVNSKSYRNLKNIVVAACLLFMLLYLFRNDLYQMDNQLIVLFAETAPNLIASFLFTLISMFFVLPYFKDIDPIRKQMVIWIINAINIIIFSLIEYVHAVSNLSSWDNNDIIASLIGIMFSTAIYFKLRKGFLEMYDQQ